MSLTHYIYRCRKQCLRVLFWIILNSLCVLGNGLAGAQALTHLVSLDFRAFLFWCCIQLAVNLIWMLQIKCINPSKEKALQEMDQAMRADITENLSKSGWQQFQTNPQETYISWLTYDIETINDLGFEVLELMLSQGFNILFGIITLIVYHPSFLVTLLVFTGFMTMIPKAFHKQLSQEAIAFTQKNEALIHQMTNQLSGFRILLGANRLIDLQTKILKSAADYGLHKIRYAKTFGNLMATQNGASFISQIVVIAQAGFLYSLGFVPIGSVSSAPYFASIVFASLTGFFANYTELKNCRAIFKKWQSLSPLKETSDISPNFTDKLELKNIQISRDQQTILSYPNISLKIGQKIALIGPSGSGKSSLLASMLKEIVPNAGHFTLDGQPYEQFTHEQIYQLINLVPQESYLFEDSLRYNLTLGVPHTDEALLELLDKLALSDWLKQQPLGLDTPISLTTTSGGQAQRICLARAILTDQPILLLDEATSALEPKLRQLVENQLLNLNKTLIMVTHHLSPETAEGLDQIICLN